MLGLKYTATAFFVCFSLFALHLAAAVLLEERRFSKRKTLFLWILTGVVFFAVVYLCYGLLPRPLRLPVSLTVSFVVYWCMFIYASADGFWKKCYLWVSYGCVFCSLWAFSSALSSLFVSRNPSSILVYFLRCMIQMVLCIPLLLAYRRYVRESIREVSGFYAKDWRRLFVVSILYFIMFLMLLVKMRSQESLDAGFVFFYLLVVLSFVAVNVVSISNIYYLKREVRDELVRRNVEYLNAYVERVRETERETRRIRHDVRHHYQSIASMARKGDTEGILKYLGEEEERNEGPVSFCPHVMVNEILSSYRNKTQKAGIAFIAQADTPFHSRINDVDFVAILSNLLENALNATIEASKDMESDPAYIKIHATVRSVGEKTVIVVSNPAKEGLRLENGLPVNRSTGIDSITTSAKRYNGEVEYRMEDGVCTVCVVLSP